MNNKSTILKVLILIVVIFSGFLVYLWNLQINQPIVCGKEFSQQKGILEIQTKEQDPDEPTFDGSVYVDLGEDQRKEASIIMMMSAVRGYAVHIYNLQFSKRISNELRTLPPKEVGFVSQSGQHILFPFDTSNFDFNLSFDPPFRPALVRLVNRSKGFITNCDEFQTEQDQSGTIFVKFRLIRSPLIFFFAIVLMVSIVIFMVLILNLSKIETLSPAVASFFISVWSLRNLLSSEIKTFPTFMDCFILSICVIMLALLLWKIWSIKNENVR
jgi:hypothetical protein